MKRVILLFIVVMGLFVIMGAGEYRQYTNTKQITVVTDDGDDSTFVAKATFGVGPVYGFRTLQAKIKIGNAKPAYAGLGNADSVWLWIYTKLPTGDLIQVDSVVQNSLPCSLITTIHSNVGDTLLQSELYIGYQIYDSLGDTALTVEYPIKYDMWIK